MVTTVTTYFPPARVRVSRFYQSYFLLLVLRAPDFSAHVRENVRIDARKDARIASQNRISENIYAMYTSRIFQIRCRKL